MGAAVLAPAVLSTSAANADGYAYWSYWHNKGGGFTYSGCGPYYPYGECVPKDGTIEGWRFVSTSSADESRALAPRYSGTFDQICGSTAAVAGKKRVAFAVDFGTLPNAPAAVRVACAVGDPNDNGGVMLQRVFPVETGKDSFVCRIDSYPKTCGDGSGSAGAVTPTPTPTKTAASGGSSTTAPTSKPAATSGATSGSTAAPGSTSASNSSGASGTASPTHPSASPGASAAAATPASTENPLGHAPTAANFEPPVAVGAGTKKSGSGSPVGTIVGIAVIAIGAAGGLITARRRRAT